MGNSAMVPFWLSWLCNTKLMQGVHNQTLILATGKAGCDKHTWRNFNVATHCLSSAANPLNSGGFRYGTLGYWTITLHRMQHIEALLDIGISVFVFEPDAVWVQNPLADAALVDAGGDIRSLNDGGKKDGLGFGWLLLRPTKITKALFRQVINEYGADVNKHKHLPPSAKVEVKGEQAHFQRLLREKENHSSFANISFSYFSPLRYVNGMWYKKDTYRKQVQAAGTPYVINNNWLIGNDRKMSRAKQWGHWFVQNEKEGSCEDETKLKLQLDRMLKTTKTLKPP